ncbi:MAG: NADPH-dependent F420 reductase [Acidobacteria bacterium]|nr:NADPH-dependent F420 reductase [Acidobacteriota bacterium]
MNITFIGGTGPAGIGLAARFAKAGHKISVGSRKIERAENTRDQVLALAGGGDVTAGVNQDVVGSADVVFFTVPPEGLRPTAKSLGPQLAGKVVVSLTNPLSVVKRKVVYDYPEERSLAEAVQINAPEAKVVGALHEIRVSDFAEIERRIEGDTIITGDDEDAKKVVMDLVGEIDGIRPVDGGPLSNTGFVEGFVAVLISINFKYKIGSSYRITGIR